MSKDGIHEQVTEGVTPRDRAESGRARVVALWEGGYASAPLPEQGELTIGRASANGLVLEHTSVSRVHARLVVDARSRALTLEDLGSGNGSRVHGAKLAVGRPQPVAFGSIIEIGSVLLVLQPGAGTGAGAGAGRGDERATGGPGAGQMARTLDLADRVAASRIAVLILGETGVGKGVLAERIHARSGRTGPLLPLNCGALPETLLEAELFGHEKGAFTGAAGAKPGLFETASGGTVFLDEVGELPAATQVKLLRVLENGEVLRVGGRRPIQVDVRIVAATNRDVLELVEQGRFRRDLYFRLNGISLEIPPLRARKDEILPLARAFLEGAARARGVPTPALSEAAVARLLSHDWPGSIRELKNTMERAAVLSGTRPVGVEHLMLGDVAPARETPASREQGALRSDLDHFERDRIVQALASVGGNQTRAAELLGISRRTLLRRLDEYDLARPKK